MTVALMLIGIILLILEIITTSSVLVWFGFGFIGAAITSVFTSNYIIISVVGIIVTILTIVFLREKYVNRFNKVKGIKTSYEEVLGKEGYVKKEFRANTHDIGIVRVNNMDWSAISSDIKENEVFKENDKVEILKIDGVKLIVKKNNKGE